MFFDAICFAILREISFVFKCSKLFFAIYSVFNFISVLFSKNEYNCLYDSFCFFISELFEFNWFSFDVDSCSNQFNVVKRYSLFSFFKFSLSMLKRNFFAFSFSKIVFLIDEKEDSEGSDISLWIWFNSSSEKMSILFFWIY